MPFSFSSSLYAPISPNVFIDAITFELCGAQYERLSGDVTIGSVTGSAVAPAAAVADAAGPDPVGVHAASAAAPAPAAASFRNSLRAIFRAITRLPVPPHPTDGRLRRRRYQAAARSASGIAHEGQIGSTLPANGATREPHGSCGRPQRA